VPGRVSVPAILVLVGMVVTSTCSWTPPGAASLAASRAQQQHLDSKPCQLHRVLGVLGQQRTDKGFRQG